MTGSKQFNKHSNNHVLRDGVNWGKIGKPDLHPLRRGSLRAQELVEFALIFPVLMLFVFAIIDFGRVFHVLIAISNAAREGARYGIIHGINQSGEPPNDSVIDMATIQEAGNFNLQLTAEQVTSSCPPDNQCFAGQPLRVEVTYFFDPFIDFLFSDTYLTLMRDMEMMIPWIPE